MADSADGGDGGRVKVRGELHGHPSACHGAGSLIDFKRPRSPSLALCALAWIPQPANQPASIPRHMQQGTTASGTGGVVRDAEDAVAVAADKVAALSVQDEVRKEGSGLIDGVGSLGVHGAAVAREESADPHPHNNRARPRRPRRRRARRRRVAVARRLRPPLGCASRPRSLSRGRPAVRPHSSSSRYEGGLGLEKGREECVQKES